MFQYILLVFPSGTVGLGLELAGRKQWERQVRRTPWERQLRRTGSLPRRPPGTAPLVGLRRAIHSKKPQFRRIIINRRHSYHHYLARERPRLSRPERSGWRALGLDDSDIASLRDNPLTTADNPSPLRDLPGALR
jgi:hypothetical protein